MEGGGDDRRWRSSTRGVYMQTMFGYTAKFGWYTNQVRIYNVIRNTTLINWEDRNKSKTFGEIELKYISVGDLTFFVELLDKVKGDKEFVTNFRKAIKTYYQKRVERLQTALGPMIESSIQV